MNTGSEFNPLEEFDKYGVRNPFQDPSRGRIDNFVVDEANTVDIDPTFVLQNMTQKI